MKPQTIMATLFFSISYSWSDDWIPKPLRKFNKSFCNYVDWKFKRVKTFPFLIWGSIFQFLTGFGWMIPGECWRFAKFLASSLNGLELIIMESAKEVFAFYETGNSNKGYQWEGLAQMTYRLLWTFTINIWIITVALYKAQLNQPAWRNQNRITYHTSITPHIPPLIISVFAAEKPGLHRKIIS